MTLESSNLDRWLNALGYDGSLGIIHRAGSSVSADHPYAREIDLLMKSETGLGASAVFEIDAVPTVCFFDSQSENPITQDFINEVRSKIWNQNLVSIIFVIDQDSATPYPAAKKLTPLEPIQINDTSNTGAFSATDVSYGGIQERLPSWFDRKLRVDNVLLENIGEVVNRLIEDNALITEQAQLIIGKCIFVSYLEHRSIVGDPYRQRRNVGKLIELLGKKDSAGLNLLFRQLKKDFNGDLLEIEGGANVDWRDLNPKDLCLLHDFLCQTRIKNGQRSLWAYDFNHIPVELISGIYESFLNDNQREKGSVYTPRHLAMLAVDQAFDNVYQPWTKVLLDGACGSGILLTTAYRRMLGMAALSKRHRLTFEQRKDILLGCIRGCDISTAAIKVTAFSLYLALLEDLAPYDISLLQDDENVKLPKLLNQILYSDEEGDFFSDKNPVASEASADLLISNPPWFQPNESDEHSYEKWWSANDLKTLPRRQIALAFARKATKALKPEGKLCLILPASVLAGSGMESFLIQWFRELQPERIFNFSDMRFILFPGADHPTAIVVGQRRSIATTGKIPSNEVFEYLVPKADVSLAMGRLTVHSVDRKNLYVLDVCENPEILRTYFWGSQFDYSLIAKLSLNGTFAKLTDNNEPRLSFCKGFRVTDKSREPVSTEPLRGYSFLRTEVAQNNYPKELLFIPKGRLEDFPKDLLELPRLGSKDNLAFDGARVLFPDGASSELQVRACFTSDKFCFTDTIAAIVDHQNDELLMKFIAVYLRSSLVSYLLFYTGFSVAMERPHVKMAEIQRLPFILPDSHPNPKWANELLTKISEEIDNLVKADLLGDEIDCSTRTYFDNFIFKYFGLTEAESKVVLDTCKYLIPNRQPHNIRASSLNLYSGATAADFSTYAQTLKDELDLWRERLKGQGFFSINITAAPSVLTGSIAVVKLTLVDQAVQSVSVDTNSDNLIKLMNILRQEDEFPIVGTESLSAVSDFLIQHGSDLYLVKPTVKRLWLANSAVNDAFQLVQAIRAIYQPEFTDIKSVLHQRVDS